MSTHRAAGRPRVLPRTSTGRLVAWLLFAAFMALLVMGTVLTLAGKGAQ